MARHCSRLERLSFDMRRPRSVQLVGRQQRQRVEIDRQPDAHADAGGGKAVVPADLFAERAADERRQERADIDADIEDRIGAVAPMIAGRIKAADLRRNIRLERAVAENERQQREQEQLLDRHHEMADRHQDGADDDGAALADHAVGQEAAEDRREIDQRGIKAPDLRRQRLHVERAEDRFERALHREQAAHVAGMLGQQQVFRHVEHEQRAHPVIREALPHLGGEQEGEAPRVAENLGAASGPIDGNRGSAINHRHTPSCHAPRKRGTQ